LTLEQANLLILDEPTNHLDISSREALETVLEDYDGTILFVSHDRYLVDRIANRVWMVDNGNVQEYLGNYGDYLRIRDRARAAQARVAAPAEPAPVATPERRGERSRASDAEQKRLRQDLASAEKLVSRLEQKLNQLSDDLALATIDQDVERITALGAHYEAVQQELEQAYARWEKLGDQLSETLEAVNS
jgi:ATP-binding cassette subfamily F protein 3